MVGEGLSSTEINQQAAAFEIPFKVSRSQVDYFRKTRNVDIKKMIQDSEFDALNSGLALKAERVKRLQLLAALMEEDLFGGVLWVNDVKGIGRGEDFQTVYIERFNQSETSEYRATLDQIAGEVGDKKPDQLIPSEIKVAFVSANGKDS